jgi:uncharacterized OB-fold protein
MAHAKRAPEPTALSKPFWDAARDERLLLQRSVATGHPQFFPRPVDLSGPGPLEWVQARGHGRLLSFTECHMPAAGFEGELPYVLGIVQLDESPRMLAQIVGASAADLAVGQRVTLRWLPREDGSRIPALAPLSEPSP